MTIGDTTEVGTTFLFPVATPKKLLLEWEAIGGMHDVLHIHGFKSDPVQLGGEVYVTAEVEVSACFDSDNVAHTLNYVQLLDLLKQLQQQDPSDAKLMLQHFERLCLCAPHVVAATVRGMGQGASGTEGNCLPIQVRPQRPKPTQSNDTPAETLVTCEVLSYFTIHVTIGCAPMERGTLQPLNMRLLFDADALPYLHMHGDLVRLAVARAVASEECYTIERAAAVALNAAGDALRMARVIKVVVEKPEIGFLTQHAMEFASFSMTRRRRQDHTNDNEKAMDEHENVIQQYLNPKRKPTNAVAATNFKALSQHSSEYKMVATRVLHALRSVYEQKGAKLRVLDVGSGYGWLVHACLGPFIAQQDDQHCIDHYCAFEPNASFHAELSQHASDLGLSESAGTFSLRTERFSPTSAFTSPPCATFDVVVFCHSLYESKRGEGVGLVQHALSLLAPGGRCLVFHRAKRIFNALPRLDKTLGPIATLMSVYVDHAVVALPQGEVDQACAVLGAYYGADVPRAIAKQLIVDVTQDGHALDATMVSMVWGRKATPPTASALDALVSALGAGVVLVRGTVEYLRRLSTLKNKGARRQHPLAVVEPRSTQDVVATVRWCQRFGVGFTVGGGCHSSHCTAVDQLMVSLSSMRRVSLDVEHAKLSCEGGCLLGDIVAVLDPASLMIPLGSRPSVGMGLVLHGGLGHYTRTLGFSCDYILSATVVLPNGSVVVATADENMDVLVCLRGAGGTIGVVTSITFQCLPFQPLEIRRAPFYGLDEYFELCATAAATTPNVSIDAYVTADASIPSSIQSFTPVGALGNGLSPTCMNTANAIAAPHHTTTYLELFEAELHCEFPKAAEDFKRTLLIPSRCAQEASRELRAAMQRAPTAKCYLHVMQCGPVGPSLGPEQTVSPRAWEWAVVITARWDASCDATRCRQWVYGTLDALPMCYVYAADLGHGAQDALYGFRAFGSATCLQHTATIKSETDAMLLMANGKSLMYPPQPRPLIMGNSEKCPPSLIIALCGKRYSGKDAVAAVLADALEAQHHVWSAAVGAHRPSSISAPPLRVRVLSISDAFKKDWCQRHGVDFERMMTDRAYKEAYRPSMNMEASSMTPQTNVASLQAVLCGQSDSDDRPDIVIVTGMRERNLADTLAACGVRFLRVLVRAEDATRKQRGWVASDQDRHPRETDIDAIADWDAVLNNNAVGFDAIRLELMDHVIPAALGTRLGHALDTIVPLPASVLRLVRSVSNFPFVGVDFKDVVGIASHNPSWQRMPNTPTMLQRVSEWMADTIRTAYPQCAAIVTVESGGCIWAAPVAVILQLPLVVVRKRGAFSSDTPKEPPPSHVVRHKGSNASRHATTLEVRCGAFPQGGAIVLVDDVYASGRTARCIGTIVASARSTMVGIVCVARFPLCEDLPDAATVLRPEVHSVVSFPCR